MFDLIFGTSTQQLVSKIVTIVAILVAVYLFLYFFSNFKPVQSLFYGIIFVVLIISGIMSFGNLNIYYNSNGGVFGEISEIFEKNHVEIIEDEKDIFFNFSNVVLMKNADGKYSASITSDKILKLDSNENYFIYVNNEPCQTIKCEEKDIYATYNYLFMDRVLGEYKALAEDTMTLYFALYDNYSYLYIEVANGVDTASLWNSYFTKNDFKVRISKVNNEIYTKKDYKTIKFYTNDYEFIKSVTIRENSDYYLPIISHNGKSYAFWGNIEGEYIEKITNINKDLTFYALDYIPVINANYKQDFEYWQADSVLEITTKTYNAKVSIESYNLVNYLQNETFSEIEISLNILSTTRIIDNENNTIDSCTPERYDSLTIKILSNNEVTCSTEKLKSYYPGDDQLSIEIDHTLNLNSGYSISEKNITFNGTFTIENLLQLYRERYPEKTFTYNIFTDYEIVGIEQIKIYQ